MSKARTQQVSFTSPYTSQFFFSFFLLFYSILLYSILFYRIPISCNFISTIHFFSDKTFSKLSKSLSTPTLASAPTRTAFTPCFFSFSSYYLHLSVLHHHIISPLTFISTHQHLFKFTHILFSSSLLSLYILPPPPSFYSLSPPKFLLLCNIDVAMYALKESNALVEEWMLLANITGQFHFHS